ncbi:hypothetical protein WDU94_012160 [Cyamophila willieti]
MTDSINKLNDETIEQSATFNNSDTIQKTARTDAPDLNNSSSDKLMVKENHLTMNGVDITPRLNNEENKLNYRPSSTERIGLGLNKAPKSGTSDNTGKLKITTSDKEDKIQTELTRNTAKINGTNKKSTSVSKSKSTSVKQDATTEITTKTKSTSLKANKGDHVRATSVKDTHPRSKDLENKNSAKSRPKQNSIELRETNYFSEATKAVSPQESIPLEENKGFSPELTPANESFTKSSTLLSNEEVKSKLEEIKETNRSKLVVLVPPFEQYKSYMNDNYSDSDDNESFDLEEFLRKEEQNSDPYLPDFEHESDNEFDKLCKENMEELSHLYPENVCRNRNRDKLNGSARKKGNVGSKRTTRSLEDDELRRQQCKMMDNIKNSQQYEKITQEHSEASSGSGKCKQKCLQRPSTAPGGRKFGCDCKWPRVKLPEYNGLRSEYGLSAEQLCERKRQRQEITKRMRERRQKKVYEEERKRIENERMFHEWLLKKRQQAKEQWMRNQRLRSMRYSRQCITPNQ